MTACFFDGKQFSEGAVICANGHELRCEPDGRWKDSGACAKVALGFASDGDISDTQVVLINQIAALQSMFRAHSHSFRGSINGNQCVGQTDTSYSIGTDFEGNNEPD